MVAKLSLRPSATGIPWSRKNAVHTEAVIFGATTPSCGNAGVGEKQRLPQISLPNVPLGSKHPSKNAMPKLCDLFVIEQPLSSSSTESRSQNVRQEEKQT